jgi:hypothetical protein
MNDITINGDWWRVIRVPAGDPRLIDRTGQPRLGTTDPHTHTIAILDTLEPPMLDRVLLHEVAHAVTISWGMLPILHAYAMRGDLAGLEEWAAQLVENHAIEAVEAARIALGRQICIRELCI